MSPVFLCNGLRPTKTNEALFFYKTNIFIIYFYV